MKLKIKALSPKIGKEIPLPSYATAGSAGLDLRACIDAPVTVEPGQRLSIPTGFAIALPDPGWVALIYARSGLAVKHGIAPCNCVGVVDSDYRGEIVVALQSYAGEAYTIQPGERIAQMVITPVAQADIELVDELDDTARGAGGFGSTGKG